MEDSKRALRRLFAAEAVPTGVGKADTDETIPARRQHSVRALEMHPYGIGVTIKGDIAVILSGARPQRVLRNFVQEVSTDERVLEKEDIGVLEWRRIFADGIAMARKGVP